VGVGACSVLAVLATPIQMANIAYADQFEEQIRVIQGEVDALQGKAGELNQKADSLKQAIASLKTEQRMIQAQIELSQAKFDKLSSDIAENKEKLKQNQAALGEMFADLYVDDEVSPLEMIASSNNVSEYMDKQEYRTAVSERLNDTITSVKDLKKQLEDDQKKVKQVLADQASQKKAKQAKEAEQKKLLKETKGKESAYRKQMSSKQGEIDSLRQQQAAAIASRASTGTGYTQLGGGGGGGYPAQWANAPMNSYVDDWGMYSRQCVSYTAWKVATTYGNMPYWGGQGNANQWPGSARAAGIPVGSTPKAGSVGIQYSGEYGHAVWVESVNGDGTLTISQYNAGWTGEFSRWRVDRSFLNEYIYFGDK